MYDFAGESSDELSFARGELIRVIDAVSDEWWRGELRGRTGIFPTNYVVCSSSFLHNLVCFCDAHDSPLGRNLLLLLLPLRAKHPAQ
ncbi:MAG: SH3 domain-containing protein [Microbacterium hominis]|nr:SH3 domain-containing protein [Microbacterium hominis]